MLYVSKILNRNKFIVTDTSDGVSEVATREKLTYCVKDLGIDIKGCELHSDLPRLNIYAVSLDSSGKTAKLAVLKGVNLQLDNGVLVGVDITSRSGGTVTVRLSDYCQSVGDYILSKGYSGDTTVVFVLDDSVKVSSKALMDYSKVRDKVVFDLRECSDKNAFRVYDQLSAYTVLVANTPASTESMHCIDNQRRMEVAATKWLLSERVFYVRYESVNWFPYMKAYEQEMYDFYYKKVASLVKIDAELKSSKSGGLNKVLGNRWRENDYLKDASLKGDFTQIAGILRSSTLSSNKGFNVLLNYIVLWGFDNAFGLIYLTIVRRFLKKLRESY